MQLVYLLFKLDLRILCETTEVKFTNETSKQTFAKHPDKEAHRNREKERLGDYKPRHCQGRLEKLSD